MRVELVTEKKAYLLRVSAPVLDSMRRWSNDELRSLNAQIEYVLRKALRKAERLKLNQESARDAAPANDAADTLRNQRRK